MAFSPEDLAQLGTFIDSRIAAAADVPAPEPTAQDRASQVGVPDVPFDAGPEFYVHLANGDVITSHDSTSTHLTDESGHSVQVIGRFQVGA